MDYKAKKLLERFSGEQLNLDNVKLDDPNDILNLYLKNLKKKIGINGVIGILSDFVENSVFCGVCEEQRWHLKKLDENVRLETGMGLVEYLNKLCPQTAMKFSEIMEELERPSHLL